MNEQKPEAESLQSEATQSAPLTDAALAESPPANDSQPNRQSEPIGQRHLFFVFVIALVLSLAAFAYFYQQGMTNVYGDGLARLNIARKVVDSPDDSFWQRYIQVGSPWLPLQTFLMLPLVANDSMWRSGAAGSIISMLFYVLGALALYRHANILYRAEGRLYAKFLPALAVAIFLLNPSVLYMQATPMTEVVFMGATAMAACRLQLWVIEPTTGRLVLAAITMMTATLARYEAWPLAMVAALIVLLAGHSGWRERVKNASLFSLIVVSAPVYWLWHNWAIYGNPLEFLSGEYSARSIYLQNQIRLSWSQMFAGHLLPSFLLIFFTVAVLAGPLLLLGGVGGVLRLAAIRRRAIIECAPAFLLVIPFLFHVFSIYRGEMQMFPLSAFGLLNIRYGLPHIIAVALFAPAIIPALRRVGEKRALVIGALLITLQYGWLLSEGVSQIAIYQEGYRNGVNAASVRERAKMASLIAAAAPQRMIWMHTGALGALVSQSGLRFADIVHEGSARWHEINDHLPKDVVAIIFQEGDPIDRELRENAALAADVATHFRETGAVGKMRLLQRTTTSK